MIIQILIIITAIIVALCFGIFITAIVFIYWAIKTEEKREYDDF